MNALKPTKRLRLLTNRDFPDGKSLEAIERDQITGQFFWYAEDVPLGIVACFPCDYAFVLEKFAECGRTFDASKLAPLVERAS